MVKMGLASGSMTQISTDVYFLHSSPLIGGGEQGHSAARRAVKQKPISSGEYYPAFGPNV